MAARTLTPIESQLHRAMIRVGVDRDHAIHDHTRSVLSNHSDYIVTPGEFRRMDVRRATDGWSIGFVPHSWVDVHRDNASDFGIAIIPQVKAGPYRVDFIVMCSGNAALLAIECDGHDWHERTKQQAASDRARDRHLLRFGISTIRFTGSEIFHDAEQCAGEVIDTMRAVRDGQERTELLAIDYYEHQSETGAAYDADCRRYQAEKAMRAAGWPHQWPEEVA